MLTPRLRTLNTGQSFHDCQEMQLSGDLLENGLPRCLLPGRQPADPGRRADAKGAMGYPINHFVAYRRGQPRVVG